jgi:hypothetical protein
MDHSEAANSHAVERYLLREMTEPEAESFEMHFFECAVCTEELASGAALAENVRAVSAEKPVRAVEPVPSRLAPWWRRPLFAAPAFAAVALAFTVVYQAREIARRNEPQTVVAYYFKSGARGEGASIPAGKKDIEIRVDPPDTSFPRYMCDLYDGAGRRYFSIESEAPASGEPLSIRVPNGLAPGIYSLKIRGVGGSQAAPEVVYRFEAVRQ